MLILAAIAYTAAGVTFVVLAFNASQNTTVETVIQNRDISGTGKIKVLHQRVFMPQFTFHYNFHYIIFCFLVFHLHFDCA